MAKRRILYLPTVSLSRRILSPKAKATLEGLGEVIWNESDENPTAAKLAEMVPGVEAVVTSWGSPAFTPEVLAACDRLKVVGHAAGSVKHLMPKEGYERGILVLSAAPVIADAVAEYTLWAMLSMSLDFYRYDKRMKVERGWREESDGWGHALYGKKVGVIAASMVGRRTIKLLKPFACDVMVYDPYLSEAAADELGVRKVDLHELMATSDIVTDHAPTTPETHHLLGAEQFRALKDGAIFINTARSWTVDGEALLAELRTGRIRAVLDVFDEEPLPADSLLRDLDNVFLTPHVAGGTTETYMGLVEAIADDMARIFAGEPSQLAVPWEKLSIMA
jgi:phosphoglycerate dehydrogenase-like enzyme